MVAVWKVDTHVYVLDIEDGQGTALLVTAGYFGGTSADKGSNDLSGL